jgi:hypothetical protein
MGKYSAIYILIFFRLFVPFSLCAQQPELISSIIDKIELYEYSQSNSKIFTHFDKTIYTNNEDVWFTTYLLQTRLKNDKYNTVSAALINDNNHKVCLEKMFVMTEGLSFGHFTIPDTLFPGSYHILTFTNVLNKNGLPEDVFSQSITIKSSKAKSYSASIALTDSSASANNTDLKAVVSVAYNVEKHPVANVEYTIAGISTKTKVNKDGKLIIDIPRRAVVDMDYLKVVIKENDEASLLTLKLPAKEDTPMVKFYPEGGNLVEGLVNLVGFEVQTPAGYPLKISGVIYKNNKAVDTIQTSSYGVGKFEIAPEKNSRYVFKIIDRPGKLDTTYRLPQAIANLPVIHIKSPLAEDTLSLQLKTAYPQKVILFVHNYSNVIAMQQLALKAPATNVKIILSGAPKGLATVTVLDTLGRPLTERLFFAHYLQKDVIDIKTDKTTYLPRQKVNVELSLENLNSMPVNGAVSVACVQDNRVQSVNQKDIISYVYLQHNLQEAPLDPLKLGFLNKEYTEDILLVRGWRRYTWQNMLHTTPNDTARNTPVVSFIGRIKKFSKVPNSPAVLTVIDPAKQLHIVNAGVNGEFYIPMDMMKLPADEKLKLMVAGDHPELYEINFNNPYTSINQKLANNVEIINYNKLPAVNTNLQSLAGLEDVHVLKEVIIKGDRNDLFYAPDHSHERGYCGDYVCRNNILNCRNHWSAYDNIPPQLGQTYATNDDNQIKYTGCIIFTKDTTTVKYKLAINGINMPKEYYQLSNQEIQNAEPEFLSTVYWNYNVKLNSKKATELSFYTGDITGPFRIIVQGVSENEMLFKELYFNVVKKNN